MVIYKYIITIDEFNGDYTMLKKEDMVKYEFEGLCAYIMDLDPFRPPVNRGITPYSLSYFKSFKQYQKNIFVRNNSHFYLNIRKSLDGFVNDLFGSFPFNNSITYGIINRYNLNLHRMYNQKTDPYLKKSGLDIYEGVSGSLMNFFLVSFFFGFAGLYLSNLMPLKQVFLIMVIFNPLIPYFIILGISTRKRRIVAEKYDGDIKNVIQQLIDRGVEQITEHRLDPTDYPIKLRNNDYNGLSYEIKGKNNYIGFFKK